jgi:hypothetical protein
MPVRTRIEAISLTSSPRLGRPKGDREWMTKLARTPPADAAGGQSVQRLARRKPSRTISSFGSVRIAR